MTLTKNDLQAIGDLIDKRLKPVDEKLVSVDKRLDSVNERLNSVDARLKQTESKIIKQMKKETKQIVKFFDEEYLGHDKRIKRIEKQFNLPPLAD